ncbi:Nif3-like dinuclear metal center hexameric protein [Adlercreutzia sp. ZJ141]|uniref:Nif3-like dinuclear metal center hexameric protein n=1 Tax=Adlercreutzia sp. ZJ141 TaxID=2709406 RepID=UPI001F149C0A|nr:Nif3-like dinuclear metal center hexameric protein [Adlercreutzia sp. ZJ141]
MTLHGKRDEENPKSSENARDDASHLDDATRGTDVTTEPTALTKRPAHAMARTVRAHTVGTLAAELLRVFPAADAEEWDRTGLVVGESALPVSRVAVALDPTVDAIREASVSGANVLVTHHPPFLSAPDSFAPERSVAASSGAGVWAAIQNQVALMCFHTSLDVSPRAARVLPGMLGLAFSGRVVEPSRSSRVRGYGQLCDVPLVDDAPETLGRLASRCVAVFGRPPRVWGDLSSPVRTAVTTTGSAGTVGRAARAAGADCLICGEIKYHEALDLSGAGLSIIELGHDVSELPLTAVLADAVANAGVPERDIIMIDQSHNWTTPEAVRV